MPLVSPGLALFERPEEHLVQPQGIGAVAVDNVVGIDHVEHRLRHLLHGPSTHIFSILKHKLGIGILRTPCTETLGVQYVVGHNVDIDMYRCHIVVVLESVAHEGIGILDSVHEVAPTLDHALVH